MIFFIIKYWVKEIYFEDHTLVIFLFFRLILQKGYSWMIIDKYNRLLKSTEIELWLCKKKKKIKISHRLQIYFSEKTHLFNMLSEESRGKLVN